MVRHFFGEKFHIEEHEELVALERVVSDLVLVVYIELAEGAEEQLE